jgi:predicted O-linked N-acetylglucosamine transferase (SPINDLY family)
VRRGLAQQRWAISSPRRASFREAARLAPDDPRIQQNLGTVCFELHSHADAEPAWLRALELRPESPYALSMLAFGRQHRCDWRGLSELHARINRLLEMDDAATEDRVNPFSLLTMPTSAAVQLRAAVRWAQGIAPPSPAPRPSLPLARGERLRVGFVSSDFRAHRWCTSRLRTGKGSIANDSRPSRTGFAPPTRADRAARARARSTTSPT